MRACIVLFAVIILAGCRGNPEPTPADAMREAASDFARVPAAEDTSAGGYLAGRVAILESVDTTRAGWVPESGYEVWTPLSEYDTRGEAILATTPDQVGSVAILDCRLDEPTGYDEAGGSRAAVASREICDMTLIDRSIPAVVHRHRFMGPEPPAVVSVDATSSLSVLEYPVAMEDVLGYLEGLPRR